MEWDEGGNEWDLRRLFLAFPVWEVGEGEADPLVWVTRHLRAACASYGRLTANCLAVSFEESMLVSNMSVLLSFLLAG